MKSINQSLENLKIYIYFSYKNNICCADLADMQLKSKYNKGIKYYLCVIDDFSKYSCVAPLKVKKGVSIVNAFRNIFKKSDRKPNKIWLGQGSEFSNNSFKKWLKDSDISIYSIFNKGISVVTERFIRTLQNKIYKHMAAISKNVYFNFLDDIVDEYNNTYHRTIEIRPMDVKNDTFAEYNEESNEKDTKFKVGDHVRISKYKNISAKVYTTNWSEEVFIIKKIKNNVPWRYVISDLNGEEMVGSFHEKRTAKKLIKKNSKLNKYLKGKEINYM